MDIVRMFSVGLVSTSKYSVERRIVMDGHASVCSLVSWIELGEK